MKIKEYGNGREDDVANELGNREKGDQIRKGDRDTDRSCYDPGSSLRKRNDLQGKDGSTSVL